MNEVAGAQTIETDSTPRLAVLEVIRKQAELARREQASEQYSPMVFGLVPAFRFLHLFPLMMNHQVQI